MKKYAFISYKVEDFSHADWVRQNLEANGIACWMAPMSIPGGSSYAVEIPNAIKSCSYFVLILSKKAQLSKWVSREVDRAINENKTILPFVIEDCGLTEEYTFYLTNVQQYGAYQDRQGALQEMLRNMTGNEPSLVGEAPQATVHKKKAKWLVIALAAVALAGAILAAVLLGGGAEPAPQPETAPTETAPTKAVFSAPGVYRLVGMTKSDGITVTGDALKEVWGDVDLTLILHKDNTGSWSGTTLTYTVQDNTVILKNGEDQPMTCQWDGSNLRIDLDDTQMIFEKTE